MAYDTDVVIAEFIETRREINNRTRLGSLYIIAHLATLGTALSTTEVSREAAIGGALLSGVLWSLWLDQAVQIWKLGAFIGTALPKRLLPGQTIGSEGFLRELDRGGREASFMLFGHGEESVPTFGTATVAYFAAANFAGSSLFLLGTYIHRVGVSQLNAFRWVGITATLLLLAFDFGYLVHYRKISSTLDRAISETQQRLRDPAETGQFCC